MTQVAATHPDIETSRIAIAFHGYDVETYLAMPKGGKGLPAVVLLHENTGIRPHFEDVARRLALQGFVVAVPDALSPVGGTPTAEAEATALINKLDRAETIELYGAVITHMKGHPASGGRVGAWGFCWGGGLASQLAIHARDLACAVVFYGGSPAADSVAELSVPLMLNYGATDQRINAGVPAFEAALKAAGKAYAKHVYPGGHAFFNDSRADRYHKASAEAAWPKVVAFLNKHLNG